VTDPHIDTTRPHEARVYDYLLGGKNNYAVDRAVGEQMLQVVPWMPDGAQRNRAFLRRAVRFVVEQGVTQFLDIGTGLPTVQNTHEVALALDPAARVVYTDYDPLVLAHARALLTGGSTAYLHGDLRRPEELLAGAAQHLDFAEPVAVMLVAVLHHLLEVDEPLRHVRTLIDAVPSGSFVVLTHATVDFLDERTGAELDKVFQNSGMQFQSRSKPDVEQFLAGLELVEPGIVPVTAWRPEHVLVGAEPAADGVGHWGAVARKP
jgi:S-adenosyl methyltransferase